MISGAFGIWQIIMVLILILNSTPFFIGLFLMMIIA